jgi:hypothetical protein
MIPKKFNLLGYTWTVKIHDGPVEAPDGDKCSGFCDYETCTIALDGSMKPEALWHAYLHEITHAVLNAIGREKLNNDEGFVDSFSGALAQVLKPAPKTTRARPRGGV